MKSGHFLKYLKPFLVFVVVFLLFLVLSPLKTQAATVVKKIVAPSGGDFTSLSAAVEWFKTNYPDFVTANIIGEIEIQGTWTNADTAGRLRINNLTTGPDNYFYIHTDANNRASAVWNTSKYRLSWNNASYTTIYVTSVNYLRIDGLQVEYTGSGNIEVINFDGTYSNPDIRISNCYIRNLNASSTASPFLASGGCSIKVWNTIIVGRNAAGYGAVRSNANLVLYNCVVIGGSYGIYHSSGSLTCKNSYAYGTTAAYYDVSSKTTCASNDTTGSPGLQNIAYDTNTFTNVTSGSEDFHLPGINSPLYHTGTDTSGDSPPMNFTTDIDGDTYFTNRSIGVDEIPPAPVVITNPATNVSTTAATLNGTLDIDDQSSVNVFFRWREKGTTEFSSTTPETKTASTTFSYDLTNLATSTIYEYKAVVSWDSQEREGSLVEFSTDLIPPIVGNEGLISTNNVSPTSLTLNWTKATDDTTSQQNLLYRLYYATSSNIDTVTNIEANGTPLNNYTADINTFDVLNLNPQTTYYFNIIVKDEGGNKSAYTMKSVTTLADTEPPTIPANLSIVTTTSFSVTFSWATSTDNVSVAGYKIFRCHTSDCTPNFLIATTTNTSFTDTDVNASSTYRYAVLAYDSSNNQSNKSNLLTITTASSNVIYANSPQYDDVVAAINQANPGDMVVVPGGTATWSSQLVITKGVVLKGAGIGKTIITSDWTSPEGLIKYAPTDAGINPLFRFSGFEINGNSKSNAFWLYGPQTLVLRNIRIDHNKFYGSPSVNLFWVRGNFWGVVDNNVFVHTPSSSNQMMANMSQNEQSWNGFGPFEFGTADNLYYEDNVITVNDMVTAGGQGGRYCFRHNTIYYVNPDVSMPPLFDAHGNQTAGVYATMGVEIYENTIYSNYKGGIFFDQRGGKAIVFNNNIITNYSVYMKVREEYLDSIDPTTNPQPQHVSESYYWNFLKNGTPQYTDNPFIESTLYYEDLARHVPTEDLDFWRHKSSFDGSSGVGVGTLSQRPSSCTTEGVAWWATDENKLYRWHNGAWELYYTPYTYPHPLRVEKVVGADKINTGTGARIYGNGKFDNLATTTSEINADLSILPIEGNDSVWLDVSINSWQTSGSYFKKWTESSNNLGSIATLHTIGDLKPNTSYTVKVDGVLGQNITGNNCTNGICLSNSNGQITFTYTGGYSEHIFEVEEYLSPTPTSTPTSTSITSTSGSVSIGNSMELEIKMDLRTKIIELQRKVLNLLQQLFQILLQQLLQLLQERLLQLRTQIP